MLLTDLHATASAVRWNVNAFNQLLRSHDGGTTWGDKVYDPAGNFTTSSDGIAAPITYQYNALSQLMSVNGGMDAVLQGSPEVAQRHSSAEPLASIPQGHKTRPQRPQKPLNSP